MACYPETAMDDNSETAKVRDAAESDGSNERTQRWEAAERIARILAAVAIPVVLAVIGVIVQAKLQNQSVQRDYVTIAVTILQEPDTKKASPELKQWAADLLNQNAPVKLPPQLLARLRSGDATLPKSQSPANSLSGAVGSLSVGPDVIERGQSANLRWNSFNATAATISPGIGPVPLTGSMNVIPLETTTYTLSLSNATSANSAAATVVVRQPPTQASPHQ